MRILVTFAVDAEFAPWRKRHAFELDAVTGTPEFEKFPFYRGVVFGHAVDVLLTGIGWLKDQARNPAAYALRELLKQKTDFCLSSGMAGGLRTDLRCGNIVAAPQVSLGTGEDRIQANANLVRLAQDAGARIENMQITGTEIVFTSSEKSALSQYGDFVDMESYFILKIAGEAKIPAVSVRVISDVLQEDLPQGLDKLVDQKGHIRILQLLTAMARRPSQIPVLVNFGEQSRSAALSLADFLDDFISLEWDDKSVAQVMRQAGAFQ